MTFFKKEKYTRKVHTSYYSNTTACLKYVMIILIFLSFQQSISLYPGYFCLLPWACSCTTYDIKANMQVHCAAIFYQNPKSCGVHQQFEGKHSNYFSLYKLSLPGDLKITCSCHLCLDKQLPTHFLIFPEKSTYIDQIAVFFFLLLLSLDIIGKPLLFLQQQQKTWAS